MDTHGIVDDCAAEEYRGFPKAMQAASGEARWTGTGHGSLLR
jgi:hypothetical protein